MAHSSPEGITLGKGSTLLSFSLSINGVLTKEELIDAWNNGKTIQSNHHNEPWHDFIKHNQVDRPNFDYGELCNWRIKPN
jgi:hypothetical protein